MTPLCHCGCQRPILSTRGAKYATARCRAKASRVRNSPMLSGKQCKTLRSAAYWLKDYSDILRDGAADSENQRVVDAVTELRTKLILLATELKRIARGEGQMPLPLKGASGPRVRQRGDDISVGVR